ncbi:MAG: glycosyltransferase family 2 protein [Kofleriaceae bacterium]
METILWNVARTDGGEFLYTLYQPILIGMVLYFSGYWWVWLATIGRNAGVIRPKPLENPPAILVVIPTLLRTPAELADLQEAAATVIGNRYPGDVTLCLSIDGGDPNLVKELRRWADTRNILVTSSPKRRGKGVAVALGLECADRELPELPPIFFNMDADSVLGPHALERMVVRLMTPGRVTRQRPIVVASNVLVRHEHYWAGWRSFFTVRYQLALQVAREYLTSISIARNNRGFLPVTGVSGALYATWTSLHREQARHAAYMQSLTWRDYVRWWFGRPLPTFATFRGTPNVEIPAGPGDDTWIAWIAMTARWCEGKLSLELPRTPAHAFGRLVRSLIVRPIGYDPQARVYTATPTTVRGLFRQRMRWNTSRAWLLQRFGVTPFVAWELGFWVMTDLVVTLMIHSVIVISLVAWPFVQRPAAWLAIMVLGMVGTFAVRLLSTLLALFQEHDMRGQWHKLLALPLSGPYHLVFNIAPTIVGYAMDFFGFGLNTQFAPETTLQAAGRGRMALAYRITRCAKLCLRALRYGDVPAGRFWFGFGATKWTANGYAGWTDPDAKAPRGGVNAREASRRSDDRYTSAPPP